MFDSCTPSAALANSLWYVYTYACVRPTMSSRSQHCLLHTGICLVSQEACSALAEVLPADVAGALARLWTLIMNGGQLSTFSAILEEQVKLFALAIALPYAIRRWIGILHGFSKTTSWLLSPLELVQPVCRVKTGITRVVDNHKRIYTVQGYREADDWPVLFCFHTITATCICSIWSVWVHSCKPLVSPSKLM